MTFDVCSIVFISVWFQHPLTFSLSFTYRMTFINCIKMILYLLCYYRMAGVRVPCLQVCGRGRTGRWCFLKYKRVFLLKYVHFVRCLSFNSGCKSVKLPLSNVHIGLTSSLIPISFTLLLGPRSPRHFRVLRLRPLNLSSLISWNFTAFHFCTCSCNCVPSDHKMTDCSSNIYCR